MFSKKNAQVEEQIMQDITDEQLDQVTGGGLIGSAVGVVGTLTGTVTGLASSVSVSGVQIGVAGVTVSTPAISTDGLISSLL